MKTALLSWTLALILIGCEAPTEPLVCPSGLDCLAETPVGPIAPPVARTWSYLKASNPGRDDGFGISIALDGDRVAVGAWNEDGPADALEDAGAVYTYRRTDAGWTPDGDIRAPNADAFDRFGRVVALSDDLLAVGAALEDGGGPLIGGDPLDNSVPESGAVYIFRRGAGGWGLDAYIKAPVPGVEDGFGASLALSGDTLAVGAPGRDRRSGGNPVGNEGTVYIFRQTPDGRWPLEAEVTALIADPDDRFGHQVSLDGDVLAVSAVQEDAAADTLDPFDNSVPESGAVYVYRRRDGQWTPDAFLKAPNAGELDRFGVSIAVSGDRLAVGALGEGSDGQGIGAPAENDNAPDSGAVYVFVNQRDTWTLDAFIKASNASPRDVFGQTLAMDKDRLAVGAVSEDSGGLDIGADPLDDSTPESGAVYLFTHGTQGWVETAYLKASNTAAFDEFGTSLAIRGDRVAVGAPGEDSADPGVDGDQANNRSPNAGAAFVRAFSADSDSR